MALWKLPTAMHFFATSAVETLKRLRELYLMYTVSTMLERLSPSRPTGTFDRGTDMLIPSESPVESSPLRTNVSFSVSSLPSTVPSSVQETDFVTEVQQGKESFQVHVP